MKPHAVYVSARWPWPSRSGRDIMIRQSLQALADEFSITYVLIGAQSQNATPALDVDYVLSLNRPGVIEIIWNFVSKRNLSLQERLFFSRRNLKAVLDLCRLKRSSAIIVDMIRLCPYLQGHAAILKICDMDDLLSKRYRQLSMFPTAVYNLFGTFGHEPIFRVLNTLAKPVLQQILRIESRLVERREIDVMLAVDLVLLVSPLEAADLSAKGGGIATVMGFPPPMPVPACGRTETKKRGLTADGSVSLLFVGDLRTPGNNLAINFIVDEILPALRATHVVYQMIIVGRAGVDTCQKIKETPYARHLGWVDDLSDVYMEADIVLCPYLVGTGVKLKVLEGMAHAKPVVTNALGAEGILAQPGSEFLIADGKEGIVKTIIELATNENLCRRVGAAATAFIAEQHDPLRLQKKLKEKVRQLLHARGTKVGHEE
jgi:glycosyltransferase involved in cell wall biosynthesis